MKTRNGGTASMDFVPIKIDIDANPKNSGAQLWQTYIEKVRTQVNEEAKDAYGEPLNNGLPKKNDILNGTFAVLVVSEDEMKRMLSPDKTVYPPCSAFDIKIFKKRDKMINSKLKGDNDSRIEIINIYDGTEVTNNVIKVSIFNGLIEKTGLDPKTGLDAKNNLFGDFGEFSCKYYFRIIIVSSDCVRFVESKVKVNKESILPRIFRYAKPVQLTKDAMLQKQRDAYYTLLTGDIVEESNEELMTKLGISPDGKLKDYIKKDYTKLKDKIEKSKEESKEELKNQLNPTRFMFHYTQNYNPTFAFKIKTIIQASVPPKPVTASAPAQANEPSTASAPAQANEPATAASGGRRKSKRFKKRSKKRSTRRRFRSKK